MCLIVWYIGISGILANLSSNLGILLSGLIDIPSNFESLTVVGIIYINDVHTRTIIGSNGVSLISVKHHLIFGTCSRLIKTYKFFKPLPIFYLYINNNHKKNSKIFNKLLSLIFSLFRPRLCSFDILLLLNCLIQKPNAFIINLIQLYFLLLFICSTTYKCFPSLLLFI